MGQKSQRLGGYARIHPLTCHSTDRHMRTPQPTRILVPQELEEFPSDPSTHPSPSAALGETNKATYRHVVQASLACMLLLPQCPKGRITRVQHQAWLGAFLCLQSSPQGKGGRVSSELADKRTTPSALRELFPSE